MAARVKDGVGRIRREDEPPVVDVDHDAGAEPLPPLDTSDRAADDALSRLDDAEAPPVEIRKDIRLFDMFAEIDPVPPLPLTAPHEVSLGLVVHRIAGFSTEDLAQDPHLRHLLRLLGNRLSVTVSPDGLSVRGLMRTRHTPWKKLQGLRFTSRYDQLKGGLVAQMADDIAATMVPIPIPGLKWLIERIVGGVTNVFESRTFTPDELEELRTGLGHSLTDIQRRGLDIELAGALRLVMFCSAGLATAIASEAAARNIQVEGLDR